MSKTLMLLALSAAAILLLPEAAAAQEAHLSGITSFAGEGSKGTLSVTGEPTIACTKTSASGSFDTGSTTTGSVTADATGCTAEFLGATPSCNTSGGATGTIAASGTFHIITANNKPGILGTVVPITMICAGFSNITISGSIIGTITSPACGVSSTTFSVSFNSNSSPTQEDMENTGVKYDLLSKTGNSGTNATAGLTSSGTLKSSTAGKLECT